MTGWWTDLARVGSGTMLRLRTALHQFSPGRLRARLANPYRPELHYMRGPGPKCAESEGARRRAVTAAPESGQSSGSPGTT